MENKINYEKLAHSLMFKIDENDLKVITAEFEYLESQLQLLDAIDTEGVEAMVYPFEKPVAYLREDKVDHVLDKDEVLANAKHTKEGHFVVPKVVK